MEIIDAHVETAATSDLSISDIANEVSLNPNYLIQCFTKSRGISPRQYMIFKKICRSKSMIASGASLIETALALGFYDQAHFIRHFRKMVGVTPGRMIIHCKKKTPIPA
jgi:AraC-like DNA-binding protein